MVSPRALATSTACLRSQFRQVILGNRCRLRVNAQSHAVAQLGRTISTTSTDRQEYRTVSVIRNRSTRWKHVNPNGRVIGRPGRRQRVVSERLKTDSLDKPSSVIIFRDVKESSESLCSDHHVQRHHRSDDSPSSASKPAPPLGRSISAEEIEGYISGQHTTPEEEEVDASIDALRPASSILEQGEFEVLLRTLAEGFTLRQLSRYAMKSVAPCVDGRASPRWLSSGDQDRAWEKSKWQPGRTPIAQRRSFVLRKAGANSKVKAADQIVRLVWDITVSTEEQQLGELEVPLQEWEAALLFDVAHKGKPNYKSIIHSQLLSEASDVQLYRPRNVMRITARRLDAEEIARQLKLALLTVQSFDFGLRTLEPAIGKPGWPQRPEGLYRRNDLDHISSLTRCLIRWEGESSLTIYSFSKSEQDSARRLLLILLDVPIPRSFDVTLEAPHSAPTAISHNAKQEVSLLPVSVIGGSMHRRYHGLKFARAIQPKDALLQEAQTSTTTTIRTELANASLPEGIGEIAQAIAQRLAEAKMGSDDLGCESQSTRKGRLVTSAWSATFCYILHHEPETPRSLDLVPDSSRSRSKPSNESLEPRTSIIHPQTPGFESFASYLVPLREEWPHAPRLLVHMIPAPLPSDHPNSALTLPRVVASFRTMVNGDLDIFSVKYVVDEQVLNVPLPTHSVDIQFKRQLYMSPPRSSLRQDETLLRLRHMLNATSAQASGPLTADAELTLPLPTSLVEPADGQPDELEKSRDSIDATYLLDRIELMQTHSLRTNLDPPILERMGNIVAKSVPNYMRFTYQDIEGGTIGSTYSSLRLFDERSTHSHKDQIPSDVTDFATGEDAEETHEYAEQEASGATSTLDLANTALCVAELLTRAHAGALPTFSTIDNNQTE